MSFFDIAILLFTLELIFNKYISNKVFLYSLYLSFITALSQIIFVGYKWQYMPLYLIIFIFSIKYTFQIKIFNRYLKILSITFLLITFSTSALLIYFLPVPNFSSQNGDYSVGINQIIIELDKNNPSAFVEISTLETDTKRKLAVDIYYPTTDETKVIQLVKNSDNNWGQFVVKYLNRAWQLSIPEFLLNHLQLSSFNVKVNANPISKNLPVVIYSHGWAGEKIFAVDQLMNLASNGYYVVAINHTGVAMFSDLSGQLILNTNSSDESVDVVQVMSGMANDIEDTVDYLQSNNYKADFNSISVMGHSTGAGAIHLYCLQNNCKSLILHDPFLTPIFEKYGEFEVIDNTYFIYSEDWYLNNFDTEQVTEIGVFKSINSEKNYAGYYLTESKHYDFVAFGVISPLTRYTFLKGNITYVDSLTTNNYFNLQAIKNSIIEETAFLKKIDTK